jgi:hypothetical protein
LKFCFARQYAPIRKRSQKSLTLAVPANIRRCWTPSYKNYGSGVSVGIPPNGVGVSVTPKLDSNQ